MVPSKQNIRRTVALHHPFGRRSTELSIFVYFPSTITDMRMLATCPPFSVLQSALSAARLPLAAGAADAPRQQGMPRIPLSTTGRQLENPSSSTRQPWRTQLARDKLHDATLVAVPSLQSYNRATTIMVSNYHCRCKVRTSSPVTSMTVAPALFVCMSAFARDFEHSPEGLSLAHYCHISIITGGRRSEFIRALHATLTSRSVLSIIVAKISPPQTDKYDALLRISVVVSSGDLTFTAGGLAKGAAPSAVHTSLDCEKAGRGRTTPAARQCHPADVRGRVVASDGLACGPGAPPPDDRVGFTREADRAINAAKRRASQRDVILYTPPTVWCRRLYRN